MAEKNRKIPSVFDTIDRYRRVFSFFFLIIVTLLVVYYILNNSFSKKMIIEEFEVPQSITASYGFTGNIISQLYFDKINLINKELK